MSVASKNLFALLGNDDGDAEPTAPVKTVEKTLPRTTKRNVEPVAPAKPATNTGSRRAGPGGNEGAYRDHNASSAANHRKPTDEAPRGGARGGRGARDRGGRGGRFSRDRDDRHTKGPVIADSGKQAAHSWGATEGDAEQKDEQAGEEIAQTELKEATAEDAQDADATPAEPEEKQVSYSEYLAQQAEKKLALSESLEIRKANEGSKGDKKWANAKPLVKEEEDNFIAGSSGKTKRERERKTKQLVDIDQRYVEPERTRGGGARGGRGTGRGGPRGGEGRGGEGRGRGGGRGRGEFRAGGGRADASINTKDESAFPSLGA
ncbi:hypothetical protein F4778DRAFT_741700 [Xylariomycetidae sp. FL2044]|nr:hypothetical protein F4778DRAFT_741700 [Xylariomycetidae sp. FL2044]